MQRSFVGSPWLCQGLRCLDWMTVVERKRDKPRRGLSLSSFQYCHLERRERTRARVRSRSRKTPSSPASAVAPEGRSYHALVRTSSWAELPPICSPRPADAGSLDCARSSAERTIFLRSG